MSENSQKKLLQRILLLGSGVAFVGSSVAFMTMFGSRPQAQVQEQVVQSSPTNPTELIQQRLKAVEKGYKQILEQEPENRFALQGLAEIRIQMKDNEGAIEPIEKLIELYPEQEGYKKVLQELKKAKLRKKNETTKKEENSK